MSEISDSPAYEGRRPIDDDACMENVQAVCGSERSGGVRATAVMARLSLWQGAPVTISSRR
jgi:hypothetical protein